jgi:hypothetical protein
MAWALLVTRVAVPLFWKFWLAMMDVGSLIVLTMRRLEALQRNRRGPNYGISPMWGRASIA